jgi:hypothetical protein
MAAVTTAVAAGLAGAGLIAQSEASRQARFDAKSAEKRAKKEAKEAEQEFQERQEQEEAVGAAVEQRQSRVRKQRRGRAEAAAGRRAPLGLGESAADITGGIKTLLGA